MRVTQDGQFIWHAEADAMINEGDFSHSPAMPHILRALRKAEKKDTALRLALEVMEMFCEHGAILKPIETRDFIKEAL